MTRRWRVRPANRPTHRETGGAQCRMRCHCEGTLRPWRSVSPSPPAGAFRAPARVSFFWCQKKDTKENHSDLRSKDPLARYAPRRPSNSTTRNRPIAQRCRSKGLCPHSFPLPLRCRCPVPRSGLVVLSSRAAEDIGPYTRLSNLFVGAGCPHPPAAPARTQKPSP